MARRTVSRKKERETLKAYYDDPKWIEKVNAMTDTEVVAVLDRLQNQGRRAA